MVGSDSSRSGRGLDGSGIVLQRFWPLGKWSCSDFGHSGKDLAAILAARERILQRFWQSGNGLAATLAARETSLQRFWQLGQCSSSSGHIQPALLAAQGGITPLALALRVLIGLTICSHHHHVCEKLDLPQLHWSDALENLHEDAIIWMSRPAR